jgi:hypothetical protein
MKLTSKMLKKIISEEIEGLKELDVPAPNAMDSAQPSKKLARDAENVVGQFKSSAQGYIDKIDTTPELVDMLGAFLGMLKQKGLSDQQISSALAKIKSMAGKGEL